MKKYLHLIFLLFLFTGVEQSFAVEKSGVSAKGDAKTVTKTRGNAPHRTNDSCD